MRMMLRSVPFGFQYVNPLVSVLPVLMGMPVIFDTFIVYVGGPAFPIQQG